MRLNDPIFSDETKARAYFEAIRWPNGPFCPHCGETDKVYRLTGKSHRPGLIHCNSCNGSFTVTTGGVMESSHIPLSKWALGFRLYAASKKGFSAHQLHRQLGITYKSAWFMAHRIREAMAPNGSEPPLGGKGKTVEVDTYIGTRAGVSRGERGGAHKIAVVGLVERGGKSRMVQVGKATKKNVHEVLHTNVDRKSLLVTDESNFYKNDTGMEHQSVNHAKKQYVKDGVHTNTIEGVFSVFKRGMIGTYQHCGEQHLQRYLHEFDFRQSNRVALGVNDTVRAERAIKGAEGKRLTYHQVDGSKGA